MGSNGKINEIVDEKAFSQVERLRDSLRDTNQELLNSINAANQFNTALGGSRSMPQLTQNVTQQQVALERLAQAQTKTALAAAQLELAQAKLQAQLDNNAARQQGNDQKAIESQARLDVLREQSGLRQQQTAARVAESEARAQAIRDRASQSERINEERNERQRQTFESNNARRAAADAERSRRQAAATAEANREFTRLEQELRRLDRVAQDTGIAFGANSREFQLAAGRANQVREQIQSINRPLGNFRDNVGNYASAITQGFSRAYGAIRTIANILPGLGISGVFLLGFEGIKKLTEALGLFTDKATQAQVANKLLVESVGGTEYQKATANVTELRTNIDLAKRGFLDKNDVLKQYNETIGKTTGQVGSLDEAERALNKNANDYIRFTFLKAVANTALQKSAELAAKAAAEALKNPGDNIEGADFATGLVDNDKKAKTFTDRLKSYFTTFRNFALGGGAVVVTDYFSGKKLITEQAAERLKKGSADLQKESDVQKKIFDDFETQAAKFSKERNYSFYGDAGKDAAKGQKSQLAAINELIETEKTRNQLVQENEKSSFDERLKSTAEFVKTTKDYIDQRQKIELAADGLTANEKLVIKRRNANAISNVDLESQKELQKLSADEQAELKSAYDNQIKLAQEADKKTIDSLEAATQRRIELNTNAANEATIALTKQYADGIIGREQYESDLLEIQTKASAEALKIQLDQLNKVIEIRKAAGFDVSKEEAESAKIRAKIDKDLTDEKIKNLKQEAELRERARKQLIEKEKEIADALISLAQTIVDAGFQRQQDEIKNQTDTIDKKAEADKKDVDRSLLTSEQKADAEALIDAQAQSQKESLSQRAKQLQNDQAKADRLFTIAKIIETTSLAVISALAPPPLGLGPVFGPAVAVAAGALGAVQLATVLATPIPQYFKGTDNAPGGLAWVGEKGRELVIDPQGRTALTPDGPTLSYLQPGTKVYTHERTTQLLSRPERLQPNGGGVMNWDEWDRRQAKHTARLEKSMGVTVSTQKITKAGFRSVQQKNNSRTEYKNRQFR